MLVSHRHRFIYTKTVKTAGTSVEVYFEPLCLPANVADAPKNRLAYEGPEGIVGARGADLGSATWRNHMPAAAIKERLGDEVWNAYFKFCVVRDPYDKTVSSFHYWHAQRHARASRSWSDAVRSWFVKPLAEDTERLRQQFKRWLAQGHAPIDRDKYLIGDAVCLDYFIRYEDLANGIRHVCETIGTPFDESRIPQLKGGIRPKRSLAAYYDAETIQIVQQKFAFEIEHFGYQPPASV